MTTMTTREEITNAILTERFRQDTLPDVNEADRTNTKNDYIANITAYVGRAAYKCGRNEREGQEFEANLIKAGALIVAAIEIFAIKE